MGDWTLRSRGDSGEPLRFFHRQRTLLTWLVSLVLVALLSAACGDNEQQLTIYSAREESLVGPIIQQFEQVSGIKVGVRYGSNAELSAAIGEEGQRSPADIFFGTDPGLLGALSDRFIQLPDSILSQVSAATRSRQGKWVGISGRARVVVYNTERLTEADLPDSLLGFTDPQWRGRIGWAPTNGSFQAMVTAMRVLWGEEQTLHWLQGIQANDPKVYSANTPIVAAVASGEIEVGFVNHYYLHRLLAVEGDAYPARNYHPRGGDPGAVMLVAGAGILTTSDNRDEAERFLSFMLSQVAQQYFASQTFEYPLVEGIVVHRDMKPLDQLELPDLDLSDLEDIAGTHALLREAGLIP